MLPKRVSIARKTSVSLEFCTFSMTPCDLKNEVPTPKIFKKVLDALLLILICIPTKTIVKGEDAITTLTTKHAKDEPDYVTFRIY